MRTLKAVIALVALIPALAFAQGKPGIRFGPLELHPYAKIAGTYDSNIYMVSPDLSAVQQGGGVKKAVISDNTFGVNAKLALTSMHTFEGGYEVAALFYSTMPKANDTINQKASLNYVYKGPMGLSAKVGDTYLNTMDPAFSESATRERRWQNTANLTGEYSILEGPAFVGVNAEQVTHKYLSSSMGALLNRYEQIFGLKGGYKVLPKTRVYAGYRRQIIHYSVHTDLPKDNKSHFIDLGVEGNIAPKLTGKIEASMSLRDYDNNNAGKSTATYVHNWAMTTQLVWKPLERCQTTLGVTRSLQESTFADNRYYESTAFNLGLTHKLPWKLTATIGAGATFDRYPKLSAVTVTGPNGTSGTTVGTRKDHIYSQNLGLDYEMKSWATIFASYSHKQKFSNFSGQYNYCDHQVSAGVKLAL
ncbi:MAG: outer membrane beta-barrel protein [Elusimicrobiota bacterium]|jgi:hypothetical protein